MLDQGIDAPGLGWRGSNADLAQGARGQTRLAGDVLPAIAAVQRAPDAAVFAAALDGVEVAPRFPDRGIDDARIVLVDAQVNRAGFVADKEHALPASPAIPRAKDAALVIAPESVSQGRYKDRIRVLRVDAQLADMPRIAQAAMLPTAPAIAGFVDAIAMRNINADGRLAHARVNDIGVALADRQRADRAGFEIAIGDILPVLPGIVGLPDAARASAKIEGADLARVPGDRDDASATEGSNAAPMPDVVQGNAHSTILCCQLGAGCEGL